MPKVKKTLRITELRIENLRAYKNATIPIQPFAVLVGNNNQGKSSALRLANWFLNEADESVLEGKRELSDAEFELLVPANQTAGKARRLTLALRFDDQRKGRRFGQTESKDALLRLSVSMTTRRVRVNEGPPTRGEAETSGEGMELLRLVRDSVAFEFVPASRDAKSARFRAGFEQRLNELLLARFVPKRAAGASREYRFAKKLLDQLEKMLTTAGDELRTEVLRNLPAGMLESAKLVFDSSPQKLSKWMREQTSLSLSTGSHDADHVPPAEVGNGLQSVLDVAMTIGSLEGKSAKKRQVVAAIEEPEAFLHPSGQRSIALVLRRLADSEKASVFITTHSPYFVDEARYGEVMLVRDQRFFTPAVTDSQRAEINTALMSARSAEVFFCKAVLLVEGPGDVALFDALLRRIQQKTLAPELSHLAVIDVGGKTSFGPWWRLLRSYGHENDRPIRWLSLLDGDAAEKDGTRAVVEAIRQVHGSVPADVEAAIVAFGDAPSNDPTDKATKAAAANSLLDSFAVRLFSVDCEWALFGGVANTSAAVVASVLGCPVPTAGDAAHQLARTAGSKVGTGKNGGGNKKPHLRRKLVEQMDLAAIPSEVEGVLRAWFGRGIAAQRVNEILASLST